MSTEMLMLAALVAVAFLVLGFVIGRFSSSGEKDRQAIQSELDHTRSELHRVQERVDDHFSESARLFSTLAHDYHALFEHFADTARDLGISERDAGRLLSPELQRLTSAVADPPTEHPEDDERPTTENTNGEGTREPEASAAPSQAHDETTDSTPRDTNEVSEAPERASRTPDEPQTGTPETTAESTPEQEAGADAAAETGDDSEDRPSAGGSRH